MKAKLIILMIVFAQTLVAQTSDETDRAIYAKETKACVKIEAIETEVLLPDNEPVAPDLIIFKEDDYSAVLYFSNTCAETIYYLGRRSYLQRHALSYVPQVFLLYGDPDAGWTSVVRRWHRKMDFSSYMYKWIPLKQGESASSYITDKSQRPGKRAVAFYVSYNIEPAEIIEVITDPFEPLRPVEINCENEKNICP